MKITYTNQEFVNDRDLIKFIILDLQSSIMKSINDKKLIKIEEEINKNRKRKLLVRDIIISGVRNIRPYYFPEYVEIKIDPNIKLPNQDIYLADLCKLINYGNLSVKGCFIFSKQFLWYQKHIKQLREKYVKFGYFIIDHEEKKED